MIETLEASTPAGSAESPDNPGEALRKVVEQAAELLPAQGPITAFAFVNTLQALEGMPFDDGLKLGSRLYRCQPYLPEERYRQALALGRIRQEDLIEILLEDLGERADVLVGRFGTRFYLRLSMLEHPLRMGPAAELRWVIAETDALVRFRPEASPTTRREMVEGVRSWLTDEVLSTKGDEHGPAAGVLRPLFKRFGRPDHGVWTEDRWEEFCLNFLWQVCRHGVHFSKPPEQPLLPARHRDLLLELTGQDPDQLVHDVLIRFCAAYLDQGQSDWALPGKSQRFWAAFRQYYSQPSLICPRWMKPLRRELERVTDAGLEPIDLVAESLHDLGVSSVQQSEFISETLLALRGWAGMIWQMETRPDRVPFPVETGTMVEFLAIRLLLDRLAARHVAATALGDREPLSGLVHRHARKLPHRHGLSIDQHAFLVFQLAQVRGWNPEVLLQSTKAEWHELVNELDAFNGIERRRVYHQAFERTYQVSALDALTVRNRAPMVSPKVPKFQAIFCIDAREESFRRHLEDVEPDAETFGTAGFFNLPIQYRGVTDAHYVTLCPIVIRPQHWVVEDVAFTEEETHRRRALIRRTLGSATRQFQIGSRSLASGAVLSAGVGVLASIPLVMSVLFPRLTSRLQSSARRFMAPPLETRLRLQRTGAEPGPNNGHIGFTLEEMVAFGQRVLSDIGLTRRFARLVFLMGHGSECLNNPHKSAYDCGACSGNPGGPNARSVAMILNDPRVRERLVEQGISIPEDTIFIAGLHNTCTDTIEYFDLDLLPLSNIADFREARTALERACALNAHERCRRFESAPIILTHAEAVRIVQQRAEDLAETRPEYGNCTNALCIVGRRGRTRGLFLDRRAFLMSYEPMQDDEEYTILGRILGAVVPVCEGINLQYTMSNIDPAGWGCSTKLPHNVTGLLGVMDGAASDLRPGLPWQGCDIHEPVRLLFIIETVPEAVRKIMSRSDVVDRIIRNHWIHVALQHPETGELSVYRNDEFLPYQHRSVSLPVVESWESWYGGSRDNLGFAMQSLNGSRESS